MSKDTYLSIVELAKNLNKKANKLDKGKLTLDEISEMLDNSRDIYERMTILHYKALLENKDGEKKQEEIKEKNTYKKKPPVPEILREEENGFLFNFEQEELPKISPNQRNLLDEIQEVGGEKEGNTSVNEQYASTPNQTESVVDKLNKSKIQDLKSSIGLNQRFLFINDLFSGNKEEFEHAIDKINSFDSIIEAKAYLSSDIEKKHNWEEESEAVQQFISLIERKFN